VLQLLVGLAAVAGGQRRGEEDLEGGAGALAAEVSRGLASGALLAQALLVLRECPLSAIAQQLVTCASGRHLEQLLLGQAGEAGGGPEAPEAGAGGPQQEELGQEVEESLVLALGAVLRACQEVGLPGPPQRAGLEALLRSLVSLPCRPRVAWRAQVLACAITLMLRPEAQVDEALLLRLPDPEAALALGPEAEASAADEGQRLEDAAALLGHLLQACDEDLATGTEA